MTGSGNMGTPIRVSEGYTDGGGRYRNLVDAKGRDICGESWFDEEWAAFIVEAVNSHASTQARIAELEGALKLIQFGANGRCPLCAGWNMSPNGETDGVHTKGCQIRAALASKEGGHES